MTFTSVRVREDDRNSFMRLSQRVIRTKEKVEMVSEEQDEELYGASGI